MVAADTRLSSGFSIHSRDGRKILKLYALLLAPPLFGAADPGNAPSHRTDKCVIATAGMQADQLALHKALLARLQWYEHQHRKPMSTPAIAHLLSKLLYGKRFFPYYTFNVLGGLDEEGTEASGAPISHELGSDVVSFLPIVGNGVVYSYDAVGSFELMSYSSSGTGNQLVQPLLDNQVRRWCFVSQLPSTC